MNIGIFTHLILADIGLANGIRYISNANQKVVSRANGQRHFVELIDKQARVSTLRLINFQNPRAEDFVEQCWNVYSNYDDTE